MNNKLNEIQQRQEDETLQLWQDDRFNPLDPKFLPPNQQAPIDESWTDPRFASAPSEVRNPLKNNIVKFANEDADAQQLLAQAGVYDATAETSFKTRTSLGPWEGVMKFDEPSGRYVFTLQREDGERKTLFIDGDVNDPNAARSQACTQLKKADETAHIRILGSDQYLLVNRLAARDVQEAIATGLALLFGDQSDTLGFNPFEAITKSENQQALEQLMWCVFTGSPACDRLGAADLEEFEQYAADFIGNRAWNLSLLKSALDDFRTKRVNENLTALDRRTQQAQTPEIDLDSLSDEEIEKTFDSVSREFIKATRHRR